MSPSVRLLSSSPAFWTTLALVLTFILLNVLAYRQARAMTHFAPCGTRTALPEELPFFGKLKAVLWGVLVPRPNRDETPADTGLDHETITFAGGRFPLEAWYVPHAADRGLVLLFHGYTRCKADLVPEARAFHDLGYSCLLVDFPGSGGSGGNSTTIGYREADDVARAVDFARRRWPGRRLILFGQSMGAAAVLRSFAIHRVAADAVVLECPFDRLLTTVQARFAAMGLPGTPGAHLLMFWGSVLGRFNAFAHNPATYANAVGCPTLLLHGSADPRVANRHVERIYRKLPGWKRLFIFEGLGHVSYVAQMPVVWSEQVGRFLAEEAITVPAGRRTA
jgi:alpha-beta hydrolase superfamily lysophospholipase